MAADRPRHPVRDVDRQRWIEANGPGADAPGFVRTIWESTLAAMPFPERMPWHAGLVLAGDGSVWLEEVRPGEADAAVWTVFPAGGGSPRQVRFPAGFRLDAVEGERAYGVCVGEFDVQRVMVIALPR